MIIKEDQLSHNDGSYLFNHIQLLYENEMSYLPTMVPVIYNEKTKYDLIQLESFLKFGKDNNIMDGGLAVAKICEAHNIPMNNIGFVVNEENLYMNKELSDTFIQLYENNFPMMVNPISKHSVYYTKLNKAVIMDESYNSINDSENMINYYCNPIIESNYTDSGKSCSLKLAATKRLINESSKKMKEETDSTRKVILKNNIKKLKESYNYLMEKMIDIS